MARGFYQTNIEKKMKEILDNLGINYAQFFTLRGTPIEMDFAIVDKKLCIECDGSYWHKDKNKDRRRDYYLKSRGWNTIRFTDDEILNNDSLVKERLHNEVCYGENCSGPLRSARVCYDLI